MQKGQETGLIFISIFLREGKMPQYEYHQHMDPSFPVIFRFDTGAPSTNWDFGHWHEGIELLLGIEGKTCVLHDGVRDILNPGEIAVIGSGQFHIFSFLAPTCQYYCLILDREFLEYHGLPAIGIEFRPILQDAEIKRLYDLIIKEMSVQEQFFKSAVLALVLELYTKLLRGHQLSSNSHLLHQPPTVLQVINYLRQHFADDTVIEDACRFSNISRYDICRLFKKYLGMTPRAYLAAIRCKEARTLLLSGKCNVTEAAQKCGYENLSYFTKVYTRYMGTLPCKDKKISDDEHNFCII